MTKIITSLSTLFFLTFMLVSNSLSAQTNLYTEEFNYTAGTLPPGWVNDAEQPPEWDVNESMIAGGQTPELYLGYGFAVGLSRLTSVPISVSGDQNLALTYKQYLINFAADAGETIGMDVTFDDGATWQVLWERPLRFLNIPPGEYVYYIKTPPEATEMKFAFRYEGNNFFINGWAIDDISIDTVVDNDLVARNISGNTSPNIGEDAEYIVEVQNGGNVSQSTYTVNLLNEEDETLATAQGNSIDFFETQLYTLTWTPDADDAGNHSLRAVIISETDEQVINNETTLFNVVVQPENTEDIVIGNGTRSSTEVSRNFFNLNSLTQTLYLSEDINATNETIKGILYNCYVDNDLNDVPVELFIGETTQQDMSTAFVDPASLTPVFNGTLNFQKGLNQLYIPFDTTYEYTGGNLVVYTNKSYPEQVLWVGFQASQNVDVPYSRSVTNDDAPFDALNPPNAFPAFEIPNITFFFTSENLSVIDFTPSETIIVFPNPSKGIINIQTNEHILELKIFNSLGQQVFEQKNINNSFQKIDIDNFSSGFYILNITTEKGVETKKIQKL